MGQINATSFNAELLNNTLETILADNDRWNEAQRAKLAMCISSPPAGLTPRRQAVFSYVCALTTLLAQCDQQYEGRWDQSTGEAFQRRIRYFSGICPMSPKPMREAFGMQTPSWDDCSKGMSAKTFTNIRHDSEVTRFTCLWKNFETANGTMDIGKLIASMNSTLAPGDKTSAEGQDMLKEIVGWSCLYTSETGDQKYARLTPQEFARCMSENGIYSCAIQQAREAAGNFPETCSIKVKTTSQ